MIMTNEQKKNYLIYLFKFMEEYPDLDHEATKRIIENMLKSIDLSDQETRNSFKSFFVLFKDFFRTKDEIMETWISLYTRFSKPEMVVVRNAWKDFIKKA